jgi:hypothetical protein
MALTTILAVVGVALQAVGAFQAASAQKAQLQAQSQMAQYQQQVAENNAAIARQNMEDAAKRGRQAEYEHRLKVARAVGTQRAAVAGAGLLVDEDGTSTDWLVDDMVQKGELDVLKIRDNVAREQRQFAIQEMNFLANAEMSGFEGEIAASQAKAINPLMAGLTAGFGAAVGSADTLFPNAGVN